MQKDGINQVLDNVSSYCQTALCNPNSILTNRGVDSKKRYVAERVSRSGLYDPIR